MKLKYKQNFHELVNDEEIAEHNRIAQKIDGGKKPSQKEADFLMKFATKTRVCNTCGKSVDETKAWIRASLIEYPEICIGYHADCFECEMKNAMKEGILNGW